MTGRWVYAFDDRREKLSGPKITNFGDSSVLFDYRSIRAICARIHVSDQSERPICPYWPKTGRFSLSIASKSIHEITISDIQTPF
ncbi:hypothetical protein L596_019296 [Steinernema carpocapsae]|uniref:Uncharacterized protein n=1 Tax=Steinernema carpocapsae TaxID=34508 RepID=A0A4U5MQ14_STECR|nr:hypothetical protein L596_019296 [Steinernema carpocapsae]